MRLLIHISPKFFGFIFQNKKNFNNIIFLEQF